MSRTVRIATRGSRLALWQAGWVASRLKLLGIDSQEVIIETQGDRERSPFAQMQGQGFFTKAVQDAVLLKKADLAVHSFKDLPSAPVAGLTLAAIPVREDARELLLVRPENLEPGAVALPLKQGVQVGTSAVRRKAQLEALRPDLSVYELRGNVPTRVEKLRRGEYAAILLAQAGVQRLGLDLSGLYRRILEPQLLVPAPAQGALALECRQDDGELLEWLRQLDDVVARRTVLAERGLMARLAGGCQLALGASAGESPAGLELLAWYGGKLYQARGNSPEAVSEGVFQQIRADFPQVVEA
ncbi:MAG: hydroxymethylbilane synthase [Thermaceae bacterium]|nr:hydroxymethylbilane synthase [Thermaceae bacterium]